MHVNSLTNFATAASELDWVLPVITTVQFLDIKYSAQANPMPVVPPVITITLPSIFSFVQI